MAESDKTRDARLKFLHHMADNLCILSQQNARWCGHGPVLEQDIALSNIALDLLGQARLYYQYAATLDPGDMNEDDYAFQRSEREFLNLLLVEQDNGHWGKTILRQFFFDSWHHIFLKALISRQNVADPELSGIAKKAIKEVEYHLSFSSEWVRRLGDGTEESHDKMQNALEELHRFTGEFFISSPYEEALEEQGLLPDGRALKKEYEENVKALLENATLQIPEDTYFQSGGKLGRHTEEMGYILAEMQYMQRAYPNLEW